MPCGSFGRARNGGRAILRECPGLAARPGVGYTLRMAGGIAPRRELPERHLVAAWPCVARGGEGGVMGARVVIVGGGFAGAGLARRLEKVATDADIRLVCPDDYMLYLPLLPQVAAGLLPAPAAVVSLSRRLRRTVLVPGRATGVDLDARRV